MKTSPPKFSASGSGRCRALGRVAYCLGADLSNAAGAHVGFQPGGGADITARLNPSTSGKFGSQCGGHAALFFSSEPVVTFSVERRIGPRAAQSQ